MPDKPKGGEPKVGDKKIFVCMDKPSEYSTKLMEYINMFPDEKGDKSNDDNMRDVAKAMAMSFLLGSTNRDDPNNAFSGYDKKDGKYPLGKSNTNVGELPKYVADAMNNKLDDFSGELTSVNTLVGAINESLLNRENVEGREFNKGNVHTEIMPREPSCYHRVKITIERLQSKLSALAKSFGFDDSGKVSSNLDGYSKFLATGSTEPKKDQSTVTTIRGIPTDIHRDMEKDKDYLNQAILEYNKAWGECSQFWAGMYQKMFQEYIDPNTVNTAHNAMIYYKIMNDPDVSYGDKKAYTDEDKCKLIRAIMVLVSSRSHLTGQRCHRELKNLLANDTLSPYVHAYLMMKNRKTDIDSIKRDIYGTYNTMTDMMNDILDPRKGVNFFTQFRKGQVYGDKFLCRISGRNCKNNYEAFVAFYQNVEGSFKRCLEQVRDIEDNAIRLEREYAKRKKNEGKPENVFNLTKDVDNPYSWTEGHKVMGEEEHIPETLSQRVGGIFYP